MTTKSSYVPGMCNINTAEVTYRRKAMWFGVGLSVILFVGLLVLSASWWISIPLLFVPVYIAAIGYLQVKNKFCVSYGASGRQNADESSNSAQEVADDEARGADKAKTRRMNLQALGMTLFVLFVCSALLYVV